MGHHKHQPSLAKTVFNGDAALAERDTLISRLLDKDARHSDEIKEQRECIAALREKMYSFMDTLSAASDKIITLQETLLLVARSGTCPLRESILQDMSKTMLDYANIRDAEKKAICEENVHLRDEVNALQTRLAEVERRDAANDSGSTPPSHSTVTQRQIKAKRQAEAARAGRPPAKLGPPVGHKGSSRPFEPDDTVDFTLDACSTCGGALLELPNADYYKPMVEIYDNERSWTIIEAFYHVHWYMCQKCGPISSKPDSMLDGTIIGRNLLAKITLLSKSNKSQSELCETIEIMYGKRFARATIENALYVGENLMEPAKAEIVEGIKDGKCGNMDETTLVVIRFTWWLWVLIVDGKWVMYCAADTRGKSVIERMFNFKHLKMTTDAYSVYRFFAIRQLCWAHVKTKVENAVKKNETLEAQYLYGRLMSIYHLAKELPPGTPQETIDGLIAQTKDIGKKLLDLGVKAGTYVINCADNLFTAVNNPGMSFTNNPAETALRPAVIRRKVCYRFATEKGARRYCTIASCLETWKRQGRDPDAELRRLFSSG